MVYEVQNKVQEREGTGAMLRADRTIKEFHELAEKARSATGAEQDELLEEIMDIVSKNPKEFCNDTVLLLAEIIKTSILSGGKNLSDIREGLVMVCAISETYIDEATKAKVDSITSQAGFFISWRSLH